MKNVVLLGSTGSIGTSTVKVAEDLPDRIRLVGLAAGNNADLLREQTLRHRPQVVSIADPFTASIGERIRSLDETLKNECGFEKRISGELHRRILDHHHRVLML